MLIIIGNVSLAYLLIMITRIFSYMILGRIILSFFVMGYSANRNEVIDKIYRFLWSVTEPVLKPVRDIIPSLKAGAGARMDFSPIIVLVLISLLQSLIFRYVRF